ncbi:MAG: DUF2092 domain-containing protein [Xanthomonadales bacterium]|nr:DUF2092 domain-containing protein [Xanthomonadales bacterium]
MIKKTISYVVLVVLASFVLVACEAENNEQYDTRAIDSLDSMSDAIGELVAVSYTLDDEFVNAQGDEFYNQHDVYMRGPDKMYIHSVGTKGNRSYWYDGKSLSVYSFDKNTYSTVDAPDNTIKAIDYVNEKYGVDFPAADFFYPNLTDDILDVYDQVLFLGDDQINAIETTSIVASNDTRTLQVWIDKATNLPLKFLFASKSNPDKYYQAVFSNFRVNPDLPDMLFEFNAPSNAEKTELKTIK